MRIFEVLILLLLTLTILGSFFSPKKRPALLAWLPVGAAFSVLVHLLMEGHRWQMVPPYFLVAIYLIFAIPSLKGSEPGDHSKLRRIVGILGNLFGLVLLVLSGFLAYQLPVFSLPDPTGSSAVGVTEFHFVDESRDEDLSEDPGDKRELMVRVWYPANPTGQESKAAYLPGGRAMGKALSQALNMPGFLFTYLGLVETNAFVDAPIAPGSHPLIFYSHAYYPGFAEQNTVQMEELASHGYVVLNVSHPYESAAVVFPENRFVLGSKEREALIRNERSEAFPFYSTFSGAPDPLKMETLSAYLSAIPEMQASVQRWTNDVMTVVGKIDQVQSGEIESPLKGALDSSRMGIFGMDMGGMVAGQVCLFLPDFKAGLSYDGIQLGEIIGLQGDQAFMTMSTERNFRQNQPIHRRIFDHGYSVSVTGAYRFNYSDFTIVSPVFQSAGFLGSIDGNRMASIVNAYTVAFFDTYVKGKPSELLNGPSDDYPEVAIERYDRIVEDEAEAQETDTEDSDQ